MNKRHYIIPIFVPHKGCPHDCIFCNQKKITGSIKTVTSEDVQNTIETYLSTIDRQNSHVELSFFGGSFTGIPIDYQNELLEVAKKNYNDGKIDAIRLSTRPDYINEKILTNLKSYGVSIIELGVQSMDKDVLIHSDRGHTSEDVINASKLIKGYGISLGLQMMVGLPMDTLEKDVFTAKEIIKLEPDFVRIYPALVIRDTYLEYMYLNDLYKPLNVDEAVDICKRLYIEFAKHNIKIIRLGLQTTEQINLGKDVISGPFHPSFRELVESSIFNDMIRYMIEVYFVKSQKITISVSPRDISRLFADKKRYFNSTMKKYTTKKIIIQQKSDVNDMTLEYDDDKISRMMSIYEYLMLVN
jgi:histone acetyltransferase (RNA polymerase elongator complex component)